jgi:hypothetical protein
MHRPRTPYQNACQPPEYKAWCNDITSESPAVEESLSFNHRSLPYTLTSISLDLHKQNIITEFKDVSPSSRPARTTAPWYVSYDLKMSYDRHLHARFPAGTVKLIQLLLLDPHAQGQHADQHGHDAQYVHLETCLGISFLSLRCNRNSYGTDNDVQWRSWWTRPPVSRPQSRLRTLCCSRLGQDCRASGMLISKSGHGHDQSHGHGQHGHHESGQHGHHDHHGHHEHHGNEGYEEEFEEG